MKKLFTLFIVLLLSLSVAACSSGTSESEDDLVGEYVELSFSDPSSVQIDFELGDKATKNVLSIGKDEEGYSYKDNNYSGECTLGEGKLTLKTTKVIAENEVVKNNLEQMLERYPESAISDYFVYNDYLIRDLPLSAKVVSGELPKEGKNIYCDISIEDYTWTNFTLGLFEDGSCEMEAVFNSDSCFVEGTYTVDGDIISLKFTEGRIFSSEYEDVLSEMVLYMKDGQLYGTVFKKK